MSSKPFRFQQADEEAEPLVDLVDDEAVEGDAVVQQPVEGFAPHAGDAGVAQGDHVVAARLRLQHRAFAEPAAGGDACVARGLARGPVARHLGQAFDDAIPVVYRFALAADESAAGTVRSMVPSRTRAKSSGGNSLPPDGAAQHLFER
jgi:hypothetical protein